MKVIVLLWFFAILVCLGYALAFLLREGDDPRRLATALTIRIALSVLLFLLLFAAWYAGLIQPHGIAASVRYWG